MFIINGLLAQEPSSFELRINSGLSKSLSPEVLSNGWKTSINIGAGISKDISKNLYLVWDITYHNQVFDAGGYKNNSLDQSEKIIDISSNNASVVTMGINLKLDVPGNPKNKFMPYLIGGIGYFYVNQPEVKILRSRDGIDDPFNDEIIPSISESLFGLNIGIGSELFIGNSTFFIEPGANIGIGGNDTYSLFYLKLGYQFGL